MFQLTCYTVTVLPVVGDLSTEDTHIVGYVSDTIQLPCEHTVAKADLQAVLWRKVYVMIVAEFDRDDDIPVRFHGPMADRASADVFPPTLKFSNGSLEDAGVYQCEVFPVIAYPDIYRYKLTVNGKEPHYLETDVPLSDPHLEGIVYMLYVMYNICMFTQGHGLATCEAPMPDVHFSIRVHDWNILGQ